MDQRETTAQGTRGPAKGLTMSRRGFLAGTMATAAALGAAGLMAPEKALAAESPVAVWRMYNPNTGEHFYTTKTAERDHLWQVGWRNEGVGWYAPSSGDPIYRLYNPNAGDHHYTLVASERDHLVQVGWKAEGTTCCSDRDKTVRIMRQYNPNAVAGAHNFTTSPAERDSLTAVGWKDEGTAFYGVKAPAAAATAVQTHGRLHVQGTQLTDEHGQAVQLRGMSTHGIAWFPQYVCDQSFRTLRDQWGANAVRLAMYPHEYNGYCTGGDRNWLKGLVRQGVSAASNLGMYAIIDWHVLNEQSPTVYQGDAVEFFREMSSTYAGQSNVIYEICNEPNGWGGWDQVKSYANAVIPVIRANDPHAVIIVGTPEWCQRVDTAQNDRLSFDNLLYSCHFYAATHTQWLRDRVTSALDAGLPLIFSEWGTCDASGNGQVDYGQSQAWMDLARSRNISWFNWSLANKAETSSAINSWCQEIRNWSGQELSASGRWVHDRMVEQSS